MCKSIEFTHPPWKPTAISSPTIFPAPYSVHGNILQTWRNLKLRVIVILTLSPTTSYLSLDPADFISKIDPKWNHFYLYCSRWTQTSCPSSSTCLPRIHFCLSPKHVPMINFYQMLLFIVSEWTVDICSHKIVCNL